MRPHILNPVAFVRGFVEEDVEDLVWEYTGYEAEAEEGALVLGAW